MEKTAIDIKKLGLRIREERKRKDLRQKELADLVKVNNRHISYVECGTKAPSLELTVAIANALGVGLDTLLIDSLTATQTYNTAKLIEPTQALTPERIEKLQKAVDFLIENNYV